MLDTKIPRARDIPFEDWDHFLTLLAIKTVFYIKHGKKISLAEASMFFATLDQVLREKLEAIVIIGDADEHHD